MQYELWAFYSFHRHFFGPINVVPPLGVPPQMRLGYEQSPWLRTSSWLRWCSSSMPRAEHARHVIPGISGSIIYVVKPFVEAFNRFICWILCKWLAEQQSPSLEDLTQNRKSFPTFKVMSRTLIICQTSKDRKPLRSMNARRSPTQWQTGYEHQGTKTTNLPWSRPDPLNITRRLQDTTWRVYERFCRSYRVWTNSTWITQPWWTVPYTTGSFFAAKSVTVSVNVKRRYRHWDLYCKCLIAVADTSSWTTNKPVNKKDVNEFVADLEIVVVTAGPWSIGNRTISSSVSGNRNRGGELYGTRSRLLPKNKPSAGSNYADCSSPSPSNMPGLET